MLPMGEEKESLIQELTGRLERCACLAAPTKRAVLDSARWEWTGEEIRAYLSGPLEFVEREIGSVGEPQFRDLCDALRTVEDLTAVLARLGGLDGRSHF